MTLQILPLRPGQCPICAVNHDPDLPHDPTSFYYQFLFTNQWNRTPTWRDAMLHCSEKVQASWLNYLSKMGIDPDSANVHGGIKTEEELRDRIKKAQS